MLRLASSTPVSWADLASARIDETLVDHAHCEKRAASTALGLLFRHPDIPELQEPLSALAREELEHFELVLALLRRRGIPLGHAQAAPYASRLHEAVRRREPHRLLDTLLCCALIEARSCERMSLLAARLPDEELASFYRSLLAAEARHHAAYVDLALGLFGRAEVTARLAELARHEALSLPARPGGPRLHD
jgi:tRNA-(ms[2]io[6]A)-hydroxylase